MQPALAGKVTVTEALTRGTPPVRTFMLKQTRERDLALFIELGKLPRPKTPEELSDDAWSSRPSSSRS